VNLMPRRMTISDRDVRTMLRITASPDDVASGPDEPLPWSVLHGLRDLVRCDGMTFFQLDSTRQVVSMAQDLSDDDHSPDQLAELELGFWAHYPHSRPCNYPDRSGDLTSVTTFSDFLSQRQMRSSGMYSDYLRHFGAEREMLLCLPSPRYRTLRLLLYRGRARTSATATGRCSRCSGRTCTRHTWPARAPSPPTSPHASSSCCGWWRTGTRTGRSRAG